MKIKPAYEKHSDIYKQGFLFDPEESVFYTENTKGFDIPEDYKDWSVKQVKLSDYGNERLKELGITKKNNIISLIGNAQEPNSIARTDEQIFSINKRGAIEILQYGLDRRPHYKDKNPDEADGKGITKGLRYCWQTRLHPIEANLTEGKYDFSNAINTPFWSPILLEKYEAKATDLDTLVITEGQFKAFKGCLERIYTVGLTSISHFRNKDTDSLHPEIIEFVKTCKVSKVVILWDGDCTNISSKDLKEGKDLSFRPNQFYKYAQTIKNELKKYVKTKDFRVFFATINSDKIQDNPKGLDDLFTCGINPEKIRAEFEKIGETPTTFLHWNDITRDEGVKEMRSFFGLDYASKFYQKHSDLIKENSFVFYGSTYRIEKGVPILEVSKDLKTIKRIGDEYYQLTMTPVPNGKNKGQIIYEERLIPRKKAEISQDHGKDCFRNIEKFKGFTNIANHIDYQPEIGGHWNLYYNVNHKIEAGEFPTIKKFLQHLFEEHETNEMIYDYFSILYKNPTQKLPVVCLVSKEQETGKSTFIYLLKLIFKQNLSIISNTDLVSEFNSHWTSSLIVASEETMLEKKDGYEKIKSLSTAFEINRNEKNKTSSPIPCMIHFVFASNHEDSFIRIDDTDSRLWIRKIKSRTETIPDFDAKLESEIPQFVHFIQNREIKYKSKGDRLFFSAKDFQTQAKENVIKNSEPAVIKEIRAVLEEYFSIFDDIETVSLTAQDLKIHFGIRGEINYLNKEISSFFKIKKQSSTSYSFKMPHTTEANGFVTVSNRGRRFIFERKNFT